MGDGSRQSTSASDAAVSQEAICRTPTRRKPNATPPGGRIPTPVAQPQRPEPLERHAKVKSRSESFEQCERLEANPDPFQRCRRLEASPFPMGCGPIDRMMCEASDEHSQTLHFAAPSRTSYAEEASEELLCQFDMEWLACLRQSVGIRRQYGEWSRPVAHGSYRTHSRSEMAQEFRT